VVIDTDSPNGAAEVRRLTGDTLEKTPCRAARPGRGPAWFFRLPEGVRPEGADKWRQTGNYRMGFGRALHAIGVVRTGAIVIVPPSQHVNGDA
jgi:hypothetical protein